jgi:hypothetical protein
MYYNILYNLECGISAKQLIGHKSVRNQSIMLY